MSQHDLMITPQMMAYELLRLLDLPTGKPLQVAHEYLIAEDAYIYLVLYDGQEVELRYVPSFALLKSLDEFADEYLKPVAEALKLKQGKPAEPFDLMLLGARGGGSIVQASIRETA